MLALDAERRPGQPYERTVMLDMEGDREAPRPRVLRLDPSMIRHYVARRRGDPKVIRIMPPTGKTTGTPGLQMPWPREP